MTRTQDNNKVSEKQILEFRGQMLSWYDAHRRILPWRAPPKMRQNPYKVWLSEIMLQQTTVQAVQSYYTKFLRLWPDVHALAAAEQDDVLREWAGLGYYARARNLHACARVVVNDMGGVFPDDQKALQNLPGIGDYTSAAICAIAFDKPATVMDGNIERIIARYFAVESPLPKAKKTLKEFAHILFDAMEERAGDFAQSLMDLGATICTPKSPKCTLCPVQAHCKARKLRIAEDLPRREKKKPNPKKTGFVYWIENAHGEILLHRRPKKGMLAGMAGLPTSEWDEKTPNDLDFAAKATPLKQDIHHSFTHFDLELKIKTWRAGSFQAPPEYFWEEKENIAKTGLPTLFKKVLKLCQ